MDVIILVIGVFLLWQGQLKVSKTTNPWPQKKKTGRVIGVVFIIVAMVLISPIFLQ